jgi:hypothetical protein
MPIGKRIKLIGENKDAAFYEFVKKQQKIIRETSKQNEILDWQNSNFEEYHNSINY